ncbi:hypothetical protein K1516_07020 [Stenotrophomonas maltophilia]|uniref:hypothetical protein n=1 Tax=Stenotrophomonas maltophilia TaxID=40324 RepID=UPI00200D0F0C|nr:hypothetical protein [Stenotrophomonas maltophilia]UQA71863.1 hypothetical protein K1516_07020 [Stenotrophomonas maltophilia]
MIFGNGGVSLLIGGLGLAAVLILGARLVRRVSAGDPSGQHWLLRTLALLSPACVIASLAVSMIGPHLLQHRHGTSTTMGLVTSALVLMFIGAFTAPVAWRVAVQQRLRRSAATLPFFHASTASLWLLYALCAMYMPLAKAAEPALAPWLEHEGLLQSVALGLITVLHTAMKAVLLTLPVMAVRALLSRNRRGSKAEIPRPSPL